MSLKIEKKKKKKKENMNGRKSASSRRALESFINVREQVMDCKSHEDMESQTSTFAHRGDQGER